MDVTYVIARYKEDISWVEQIPNKFHTKYEIIQKDLDMPNVGREPSSFFFYIIKNYAQLRGDYYFLQGYPFDHAPDVLTTDKRYFGDLHRCDSNGNPDHLGLRMHEVLDVLGLEGKDFLFRAGCQFKVSAEEIRKHPIDFYLRCFALCCMDDSYPYVFERIMPLIFDLK